MGIYPPHLLNYTPVIIHNIIRIPYDFEQQRERLHKWLTAWTVVLRTRLPL